MEQGEVAELLLTGSTGSKSKYNWFTGGSHSFSTWKQEVTGHQKKKKKKKLPPGHNVLFCF